MEPVRFNAQEHDAGDRTCAACAMPYPQDCTCGGLVHASIDWDRGQDLMLPIEQEAITYKCDRCHESGQKIQRRWEPTEEDRRNAERIAKELTGKDWDFGSSKEPKED